MPIFTLISAVIAVVALSAYAHHKRVPLPDSIGITAVALALSLPVGPARNLIVTATYLIAIFSILVQATTVGPLVRRWNRAGA